MENEKRQPRRSGICCKNIEEHVVIDSDLPFLNAKCNSIVMLWMYVGLYKAFGKLFLLIPIPPSPSLHQTAQCLDTT